MKILIVVFLLIAICPSLFAEDAGIFSRSSKDPFDEHEVIVIGLPSRSKVGSTSDFAHLVIWFSQGRGMIFVDWREYFADRYTEVMVRVGDEKTESQRWAISTDNQATVFPGDAKVLIGRILSVPRIAVRATPYRELPITTIFDCDGLNAEIEKYPELREWVSSE